MRTLNRNKTKLWYVQPTGTQEVVDADGYFTGETRKSYGTPIKLDIHLYPSDGIVMEQIFGRDADFSKLAVSETYLSKDTLLFLSMPTGNYETTYDYIVDRNKQSLNHNNYGLRSRT